MTLNDQVRAYQACPTEAARNAIVMRMMPTIERLAGAAARRCHQIEEGDAVSAGVMAAMRAIENYADGEFEHLAKVWCKREMGRESRSLHHVKDGQYSYAKRQGIEVPWFAVVTGERDDGSVVNVVDLAADQTARVAMPDAAEDFNRFMTVITPAQQQVMALHYMNDHNVAEIAEAIDMPVGEVQRLLEDAHATIRDRMMESADVAEVLNAMTDFPDDVLEHAKLAIAEAPRLQRPPEDVLQDILRRDTGAHRSVMNVVCKMMVEKAAKALRKTSPSFAPPSQASRQPPRGLDVINAASVAVMSSMFNDWRMPDGRCLGDVKGSELEKYIVADVRRAAKYRGRAVFYEALAKRVPAGKTVRDAITEQDATKLYQQTCATVHIEFAPNKKAVAGV